MSLQRKPFGRLPDNSDVTLFVLTNKNGLTASVMDYGATLVKLETPDRHGKFTDIVLDATGYIGNDIIGDTVTQQVSLDPQNGHTRLQVWRLNISD